MKKLCAALIVSGLLVTLMGGCGEAVLDPIRQKPADEATPGGPTGEATPGAPSAQPPLDDGPDMLGAEPEVPYRGNTCQCLAGVSPMWSWDPSNTPGIECNGCIRMQGQDDINGPCRQEYLDCKSDLGCDWILVDCLANNHYDPAIIASCILPFDKDPGHKKFQAWAECACSRCSDSCVYSEPIECVAP